MRIIYECTDSSGDEEKHYKVRMEEIDIYSDAVSMVSAKGLRGARR